MKKALLVVDMQIMPFVWKDYGGKKLYQEEALITSTQSLIQKARQSNTPVYYVLYTESGPSPRAKGQPLWQVHPEIAPQAEDRLIVKYYADSFYQTNLEASLKDQAVTQVVICGVQTEFCIDTTCKSAFSHGFSVELAADCHSTFDSDILSAPQIIAHHHQILSQFAQIKPAAEINFSLSPSAL